MMSLAPLGDQVRAYIQPASIEHNLGWLQRHLGQFGTRPAPKIWAVIKADAYGHSTAAVLTGLAQADGIAVLTLEQAYVCRFLGWHKPILVMDALLTANELRDPVLSPLHLTVNNPYQLTELEKGPAPSPPYVWLRYRGSLNHAGFEHTEYGAAHTRLQRLLQAGHLAGLGHLQHYANADDPAQLHLERQLFSQVFAPRVGPRCTENSASLLLDPGFASDTDWVRSGIMLYGISPLSGSNGPSLGLEPAMTLEAPLLAVQHLRAGQAIGYGNSFQAKHAMRVGLIRCGYADGYPRNIAQNCPVLVNNRPSRIVGRVSMDTITVDLNAHPEASAGTMVTLWGTKQLPIELIAQSAATIPAQLCSGLTARVPRVSTGSGRCGDRLEPRRPPHEG
ncbi:alanine racemase [Alcaligenaceae bacterium CGII-47]|nr:alanine racemase [Alcaligenaceae bacterium CGII-47]